MKTAEEMAREYLGLIEEDVARYVANQGKVRDMAEVLTAMEIQTIKRCANELIYLGYPEDASQAILALLPTQDS